MKKQLLISLLISINLYPTTPINAQSNRNVIPPATLPEAKIWVVAEQDLLFTSFIPAKSNKSSINSLFDKYAVKSYQQALPFAKSPMLKKVHELVCNCDAEDLANEIKNHFKNEFSKVKVFEPEIQVALYEPEDYMWTAYADSWLWHLKRIEADKAWDITRGDNSVFIAILDTDFDPTHPDLATKMIVDYDPYDNQVYDCNTPGSLGHGVTVASFAAGETTETGNTPNGQLASVGFNTKFIGYKGWTSTYIQRALHASSVMGAKIVTSSAGNWTYCPDLSGIDEAIVKEILDNGTAIIMPAGNGENGTHCFCASLDPVNHGAFFPLSPYYDERVIIVSGTGQDDKHAAVDGSGLNVTHSHYPDVDLCAPGHNLMGASGTQCGVNTWPYYGSSGGTSFATPIVAGTAALMYAANPCMTPSLCQDILKNTTDPILDAASFPGMVGTGRLNAFKAVRAAEATHSTTLDLYIKDRPEDLGREDFPYHWQADRDQSPDIWVRNQQDGLTSHAHQQPEFNSAAPVWVYVRVRNKSCVTSTGNETVNLYWSKASSWSSWPQNWDGSQPTIGDQIGSVNIPVLNPGEETIIEFQWTILNPYIHLNWASCLMARIENSSIDDIVIHPNRLDDDVFYNNNIAMRNVTIIDIVPGLAPQGDVLFDKFPHGNHVYIGNPTDTDFTFDFEFGVDEAIRNQQIDRSIEARLLFDEAGWKLLLPHLNQVPNLKIVKEREIILSGDGFELKNIAIPHNTRIPVFIGYAFLDQAVTKEAQFHIRQFMSADHAILGGVHMTVRKLDHNPDHDPVIRPIVERPNEIIRLTPNPANQEVVANLKIERNQPAQLLLMDEMGMHQHLFDLNLNETKFKIDLNAHPAGRYQLVLLVNEQAADSELLIINK